MRTNVFVPFVRARGLLRCCEQLMGRPRGGLTTKIHAVVDAGGLPVRLALTTGERTTTVLCSPCYPALKSGALLLADRGYDVNRIRTFVSQHGAWANILRNETARSRSASAPTSIVRAI